MINEFLQQSPLRGFRPGKSAFNAKFSDDLLLDRQECGTADTQHFALKSQPSLG